MITSGIRERDFLQNLLPGYEAEGFTVFLRPSREMLPMFMAGYQPDAIAIKSDQKIAIEVKRDTPSSLAKIEQLQKAFSQHPEWKLRVYYIPGGPQEKAITAPSLAVIEEAISEADQLKQNGHLRAGLMAAWAALEAAARALLPESLARPQPAGKLVEALATEGILTPHEADRLRHAVDLRNGSAHGRFDLGVTEKQVAEVIITVRLLADLLAKEASAK